MPREASEMEASQEPPWPDLRLHRQTERSSHV